MPPPDTIQPSRTDKSQPKRRVTRLQVIIPAAALALVAGFYALEKRREPGVFWKRYAELEAQGGKLKLEQFQSPAAAAEQNFMMSPAWGPALLSRTPWFLDFPELLPIPNHAARNWETFRFAEWAPWEAAIEALAEAARLPHSVLPAPPGEEYQAASAHRFCRSLIVRAHAAQREGLPAKAAQSLRIVFRLYEAVSRRPELACQLSAVSIANTALFGPQRTTPWSEDDAEMIEAGLRRMDRLPDFALTLQFDRAFALRLLIDEKGRLQDPMSLDALAPRLEPVYASLLNTYEHWIEQEQAWPAKPQMSPPGFDRSGIAGNIAQMMESRQAQIGQSRSECLNVRMRVALSRLEHAFGRHSREHQRGIEKPEDLRPYLGGELPLDPFTGLPHRIAENHGKWLIRWSASGQAPGPDDVWSFPSSIPPGSLPKAGNSPAEDTK